MDAETRIDFLPGGSEKSDPEFLVKAAAGAEFSMELRARSD